MRHWAKALTVALTLVFGVAGAAWAQLAPDQFEEKLKSYDPETVAAAKAYAATFNMRATMEKAVPTLSAAVVARLKAKNPGISEDNAKVFVDTFLHAALVDNAQVIEQATMLDMLDIFSKDELVAMNQFYSSPVGAGILKKFPTLMGRLPEIARLMQSYIVPRALEAAQAALKARGVDVKI